MSKVCVRLRVVVRGVAALGAGVILTQAGLAGSSLTGNAWALQAHEVVGTQVATLVALVQLVVAVLWWRPGHGPGWPAIVSAVVLGVVMAQIVWGFDRQLALHVPFGAGVFGAELLLASGLGPATSSNIEPDPIPADQT